MEDISKLKQICKKIWKKLVLCWKELGNFFTNLFCPIFSILAAACELLQLPNNIVEAMKKAEHWCWNACGTKKIVDDMVNKIDNVVDANSKER